MNVALIRTLGYEFKTQPFCLVKSYTLKEIWFIYKDYPSRIFKNQEWRDIYVLIDLFVVYPRFLLSIIQTKESRPGETCWDPGWPIEDGGCMASICQQDGEGFCVINQWNFRVGKLNKWHLVPSLKRTVRTWTCFLFLKNGSWIVSQLPFFRSVCC